ncbi:MAG TPA: TetR/AcrR family transcriptional regulator [Polyangiaceae bacterium]|jgi:AcrR family transcriptional regulator
MTTKARRADGEATRARILDAATKLIAASGFAYASNKAIAAKAGVDLASLNYHFGSRGGLYEAVLVEAHRRLAPIEDLERIAAADVPAQEKLRALIEKVLSPRSAAAGRYASVVAREVQSPSIHLRVLERREIAPKLGVVLSILEEITGIPREDPALLRCLVSVAAPCVMMVVGRRLATLATIAAMPHDVLVAHLHTFALAGLQALGREHAASKKATRARRET